MIKLIATVTFIAQMVMCACLLVFSLPALASDAQYGNAYVEMVHAGKPPGACLDNGMLFFYVVSNAGDGVYEIEARHSGDIAMRGYLEAKKTHFAGPGLIHVEGLRMQFLGMKDLPMENGFTEKFALWRECK